MAIQTYLDQIVEELRTTLAHVSNEQGEKLVDAIIEARAVFAAGAGRSGLAVRGFAMRLMHLGFKVYVVGDTTTPSITGEDLLLIGSGSGSTGSLGVSAKKARGIGAKIGLVTIQEDSEIGKLADIVLTIPAPSPKLAGGQVSLSQQPLGSLFEQGLLLTLDAIIRLLMVKKRVEGAPCLPGTPISNKVLVEITFNSNRGSCRPG